ncbi:MAG: divalent cation transporter [Pseudoruegeria sp.]
MDGLLTALFFAFIAGIAIPVGGYLASIENMRSRWLETELRHSVLAFGAGALISAVALVLVPEGAAVLRPWQAILAFGGGAVSFAILSTLLSKTGGSYGMLLAMLLDFVPEAIAMGAKFALGSILATLLAMMIALQNLPEGFNAYRELQEAKSWPRRRLLIIFCGLALLGPLSAWLGYTYLREAEVTLGVLMLFASGGILFLMFNEIAPKVPLENSTAPPFAAVAGFLLGLLGYMTIQ